MDGLMDRLIVTDRKGQDKLMPISTPFSRVPSVSGTSCLPRQSQHKARRPTPRVG